MSLDPTDVKIIRCIIARGQPNTTQVAKCAGISWATADSRLTNLLKRGYVVSAKKDKKTTIWAIRGKT